MHLSGHEDTGYKFSISLYKVQVLLNFFGKCNSICVHFGTNTTIFNFAGTCYHYFVSLYVTTWHLIFFAFATVACNNFVYIDYLPIGE